MIKLKTKLAFSNSFADLLWTNPFWKISTQQTELEFQYEKINEKPD